MRSRFFFRHLVVTLSVGIGLLCGHGRANAHPFAAQGQVPTPVHPKILLDADWRFLRQEESLPPMRTGAAIQSWKWTFDDKGGDTHPEPANPSTDDSKAPWQIAPTGTDVFKGKIGFAWFRTVLPETAAKNPTLYFAGVDDNADVYLNGKFLLHHEGWNDAFEVPLAAAWTEKGPNLLAVRVENTAGPGGITGAVTLGGGSSVLTDPFSQTGYNDSAWRVVHLPHDYVVEGQFDEKADNSHASLPKPKAWYRKWFSAPPSAKGKQVSSSSTASIGTARFGSTGTSSEPIRAATRVSDTIISDQLLYGKKNLLAVHVDPSHNEGWWYEGGGIYRHVWLDIAPSLAIAPNGIFIKTSTPEPVAGASVGTSQVEVMTGIASRSKSSAQVQVDTKILDEKSQVVASASTLISYPGASRAPTVLTVEHPRLWSVDDPYLYRIKTDLEIDGTLVDERVTPFGIRTVRFDPEKGLILNGKPVKIQGTCNHQDFAGVGIAVPDSLEYWRVKKLRDMGCNALRMSHNPPTPSLLDACDKMGMLVMDENRFLGDSPEILGELSSLVQRDRNHPSVIMWSMCNERPEAGTAKGRQTFSAMKDLVLQLDPTRPVTSAMNSGWFNDGFTEVEDLMGVNYYPDVYDKFHSMHPAMPMFASETASTCSTRGEYADDKAKGFVSSYSFTDDSWKPVADRDFIAGSFVWTGFDYKGEPVPYGWPAINSNFGILDLCGFPKDNTYYYQAWWKSKPVVHVFPHWNWPGQEGKPIRVAVFSNAASVELLLNGKSLGSKPMPKNEHLEWTVPYEPGTLVARGVGPDGKVVAGDEVSTTGAPFAVRLVAHRKSITADGEDVEPVTVEVVDANGRVCPTASNKVLFEVSGAGLVAGVGNGNPSDHSPDKAHVRNAFHGLCLVLVGSTEQPGRIRLVATSPGLKGAGLDFTTQK